MEIETLALVIVVLAPIELAIVWGIWKLVRWTRSGAIRREVSAILQDERNIQALKALIPNVGALLDEEIDVEGQKCSRAQYLAAMVSQQAIASMTAWVASEQGATVLMGVAGRAGASAIESVKAYLHGMGIKDEDVKGMLTAIAKLGALMNSPGVSQVAGAAMSGGIPANVMGADGKINGQAVMGGILQWLMGGGLGGGQRQAIPTSTGRIGPE
jgi:hypothetical protein